ncbi:MAG: hypothetical protein ACM3JP_01135 [Betaproteobacteria bacterium]
MESLGPARADRVHVWPRLLILVAAAITVVVAVYLGVWYRSRAWPGSGYLFIIVLVSAPVVFCLSPLIVHRQRAFGITCFVASMSLAVLAILGAIFGLLLDLPAAAILLIASFAIRPRVSPGPARVDAGHGEDAPTD